MTLFFSGTCSSCFPFFSFSLLLHIYFAFFIFSLDRFLFIVSIFICFSFSVHFCSFSVSFFPCLIIFVVLIFFLWFFFVVSFIPCSLHCLFNFPLFSFLPLLSWLNCFYFMFRCPFFISSFWPYFQWVLIFVRSFHVFSVSYLSLL